MIRQFDVCLNPEARSRDRIPFIIVLQSDRFDQTRGIVVAPLVLADQVRPDLKLYPTILVDDHRLAVIVSELANVLADRDRIIAALDLLFTGI